jgi:hypothetical protein
MLGFAPKDTTVNPQYYLKRQKQLLKGRVCVANTIAARMNIRERDVPMHRYNAIKSRNKTTHTTNAI